jgi:hypothetical protein
LKGDDKMTTAPCKNCVDRCVGCHSKCKKYIEYDITRKKELEEIRKERIIQDGLNYGINIKKKLWGYTTR